MYLEKNGGPNQSLSPPLGLLYLATSLIDEGYNINFIDLNVDNFKNKKEFLNIIEENKYVFLSDYTGTINNVRKIIKDINKNYFINLIMIIKAS